jgi:hypothetical protein
MSELLNREQAIDLLGELARRLHARELEAEIYVVGGTAMALAYDRARVTRDIDAVAHPSTVVDEIATQMADDNTDLSPGWFNQQVATLLPREFDVDQIEALTWPGLTVNIASPRRLLAMKVLAGRSDRDLVDIYVLCQILELTDVDQVWGICDEVWGTDMIRPDIVMIVGDYLRSRGLR